MALWLGKKCCINRARRDEIEDANANVHTDDKRRSEGWAKRMTFTGNREKFWHRLDDYHDSLKAREEGRLGPGQVAGGVVGKKRRSRMGPELMSMRMSAVPTFTHSRTGSNTPKQPQQQLGQTYNHHQQQGHGQHRAKGDGPVPEPDQWLKNDNSSVKTFMIGNDDELAYLSTVIDDKAPPTQPQSYPHSQPQTQFQSFPVPSVGSASLSTSSSTPYDAPVGYQLTPEDVGNAVTTSIPASSSREKILLSAYSFSNGPDRNKRLSTMSTVSTGTGGVGSAMLASVAGSINEKSSVSLPFAIQSQFYIATDQVVGKGQIQPVSEYSLNIPHSKLRSPDST